MEYILLNDAKISALVQNGLAALNFFLSSIALFQIFFCLGLSKKFL
jgi:hypothetical protein